MSVVGQCRAVVCLLFAVGCDRQRSLLYAQRSVRLRLGARVLVFVLQRVFERVVLAVVLVVVLHACRSARDDQLVPGWQRERLAVRFCCHSRAAVRYRIDLILVEVAVVRPAPA